MSHGGDGVAAAETGLTENMTSVDDAAVVDAAHVLREKVDVLLDRLTDAVLGAPTPGTAQCRNLVHGAGDLTRITRGARRADVRALIAARAGVADPAAAPRNSPAPIDPKPRPRRGRGTDPAQLAIF